MREDIHAKDKKHNPTFNNRNSGLYNPCRDCNGRSPGCHGNCITYMEYKKQRDSLHEKAKWDRWYRT